MLITIFNHNKIFLVLITCMALSQVCAQPYEIKKQTINNGGGKITSNDNRFEINSSIGQIDASNTMVDAGNRFALNGGFWHQKKTTVKPELIFKNSFEQ